MKKNSDQREKYLQYRLDGYTREEALRMLYPQVPSLTTVYRWERWVEYYLVGSPSPVDGAALEVQ